MTRTVLVPLDGSPLSFEALRYSLKHFSSANITVLHVVDLFEPAFGVDPDYESAYEPLIGSEAWYDHAEEIAEQIFAEARSIAADFDRSIGEASDIGDPERIIVVYADEEDVDHIVIGAHGRPDQDRTMFGSVAEIVARRGSVPVTIIR